MKLALIPPISLLEYTDETFYQLMLPHLIESDVYTYVYRKHCEDPNQFVILDNGVAEAETVSWDQLTAIAVDFDVDEIVVPDVLGDSAATIAQAKTWVSEGYVDEYFQYMFVAQGSTYLEFLESIKWAMAQSWITTIGLPRHAIATCNDNRVRQALAMYVATFSQAKQVHLLGGAPSYPRELMDLSFAACVRSTDTSAPFNFAYAGKGMTSREAIKRPDGYFDLDQTTFDHDQTNTNVQKLMEWTGNDV